MNRYIRIVLVLVGALFAVVGIDGYMSAEKAMLVLLFLILCAIAILPDTISELHLVADVEVTRDA